MPTRTRTESKAEPQPEATDEAQTERAEPNPPEQVQAADLGQRIDALGTAVATLVEREPADVQTVLDEVHTRFDVLGAEISAAASPERSPVPAVLGQVLDVMRAVREIGKGGTAPQQMGGYKFRRVDDAIDAVGNACRDVGLVLRSEVVRLDVAPPGTGMRTAHAIMRYTFVSTTDGTEHAIEGAGEGADKGDKATSKACSMALKYALLQGLMIPVVGAHLDVESEDTRPEPQREQRPTGPQGQGAQWRTQRDQEPQSGGEAASSASDPSQDPPEVRAREVLRRANDGRPADKIKALMGAAGDAGLLGVEIEQHGHAATLQQHLLAVIRLAEQGQRADRGQS